jgi:hypothetical protein
MEALDFLEALFGLLGILLGALAVGHVFFGLALPQFFTVITLMYTLWFLVVINLGLFLYEEVRDVIYI